MESDCLERARVQLLLTEREAELLSSAVARSRGSKSLLLLEAVQRGFRKSDFTQAQGRRSYRVDAWLPGKLKELVKKTARTRGLTQQSLLRHLLFEYLNAAPWLYGSTADESPESSSTHAEDEAL